MLDDKAKKKLIITKLSNVLRDSDADVAMLESEESEKKIALKKWFLDKRTLHEIKYLASRAGTYDNFCEDELDDIETCLIKKIESDD